MPAAVADEKVDGKSSPTDSSSAHLCLLDSRCRMLLRTEDASLSAMLGCRTRSRMLDLHDTASTPHSTACQLRPCRGAVRTGMASMHFHWAAVSEVVDVCVEGKMRSMRQPHCSMRQPHCGRSSMFLCNRLPAEVCQV